MGQQMDDGIYAAVSPIASLLCAARVTKEFVMSTPARLGRNRHVGRQQRRPEDISDLEDFIDEAESRGIDIDSLPFRLKPGNGQMQRTTLGAVARSRAKGPEGHVAC